LKTWSLLLALSLMTVSAGCHKSEIDEKPAADVKATTSETSGSDTAAAATQPAGPTVKAKVIREKSSIDFVAAKVTRDHKGKFKNFDGTLEYTGGKPIGVSFEIDLSSVETDTEKLTAHLKTADFFDVATYPKATFVSTSLTEAAGGPPARTTHELRGILDLHGVKKEVTIPVRAEVTPDGVRTTSQFTIDRHDWGINYKGMADDLIKDEVLMKLDLRFPPPPAP
jgi:polyisoprenoid-binding protein YceI